MADMKTVKTGSLVTFVDPVGKEHPAMVTAVWGRSVDCEEASSVNLVLVSDNDAEQDQYGRQIKRETSIVHQSKQSAPGFYWR